jgi:hypothetical protein
LSKLLKRKSQTKDPPLPLYQTFQVSTLAKRKEEEEEEEEEEGGIEI